MPLEIKYKVIINRLTLPFPSKKDVSFQTDSESGLSLVNPQ